MNVTLDAQAHGRFMDYYEEERKANDKLQKKNFNNLVQINALRKQLLETQENIYDMSKELLKEKEEIEKQT